MRIGVIGAGRLGLSFALVCDKNGIPVTISDKNEQYLKNLKLDNKVFEKKASNFTPLSNLH